MSRRLMAVLPPLVVAVGAMLAWEAVVRVFPVPRFILPAPSVIAEAAWADRERLLAGAAQTALASGARGTSRQTNRLDDWPSKALAVCRGLVPM